MSSSSRRANRLRFRHGGEGLLLLSVTPQEASTLRAGIDERPKSSKVGVLCRRLPAALQAKLAAGGRSRAARTSAHKFSTAG